MADETAHKSTYLSNLYHKTTDYNLFLGIYYFKTYYVPLSMEPFAAANKALC